MDLPTDPTNYGPDVGVEADDAESRCSQCSGGSPPGFIAPPMREPGAAKKKKSDRRSAQDTAVYYLDCPTSFQDNFTVKGTICSPTYNCKWAGCNEHICRQRFETGEAYHTQVYDHLQTHAEGRNGEQSDASYKCKWQGCTGKPEKKRRYSRNRVRHLTKHLPWYLVCLRCATLHPRMDLKRAEGCTKAECKPTEPRIQKGLDAAEREFGKDLRNVLLSAFMAVVLSEEKQKEAGEQ